MIVGFANMLLTVWENERPRAVFVGWDTIGIPTYRHELLEGYQSGRDFPPVLTSQLDRLPELCEALGFPWGKEAGFEADDFLAAAVQVEEERGGTTLVLTSDRDLFQLASERTTLVMPVRGRLGDEPRGPGRGEGALRREAEPGARPHRAPRRQLRSHSGRQGDRREAGRDHPSDARDARRGDRRRALHRAGRCVAHVPADRAAPVPRAGARRDSGRRAGVRAGGRAGRALGTRTASRSGFEGSRPG